MDYQKIKDKRHKAHNVFATSLEAAAKAVGVLVEDGCPAVEMQQDLIQQLMTEAERHRALSTMLNKITQRQAENFVKSSEGTMH